MLSVLWTYRHFVVASIFADLKGRYARSRLGMLWTVLHPLAQALIFALILSKVIGAKFGGLNNPVAYPVYLTAGIAAWGLFSEILNRCLNVFIEQAAVMKKIAFPRLCLPIIVGGCAMLNHVLLLLSIAVVFMFFGHYPNWAWLSLPLGIAIISVFAFGLGLALGILNVFARDIGQGMTILLQIWFWLTPIVYTTEIVPKNVEWVLFLNPITPIVQLYQDALLYGRWPDPLGLLIPAMIGLMLLAFSFILFRRASSELVDAL